MTVIFKKMLSQYYNRRNSLQPKKEDSNQEEESIIQSFYEERRSRSSQNAKQHSLLRKNISYFHEERSAGKEGEGQVGRSEVKREKQVESKVASSLSSMSRPPIPKILLANPVPQPPPKPSLSKPLEPANHNRSDLSSNFSTINLSRQESEQQDYKARLKSELSKRINIKHYLTQLSEQNKQNPPKPPSRAPMELKFNYDAPLPARVEAGEEISGIFQSNGREGSPIDESRQSLTSLLHDNPNTFEFSRNDHPRALRGDSFSHSIPTLHGSAPRSDTSRTEKDDRARNVLMGEELEDLQENSHPIRNLNEGTENQPTTLKHNLKYFQPEAHAEYKRRIGDLQRELSGLREQHRREQKFIQSIQKMRRLMQGPGGEQDCSLKELWRWIKALPQRK